MAVTLDVITADSLRPVHHLPVAVGANFYILGAAGCEC